MPPSLSVAVAVTSSVVYEAGTWNVKIDPETGGDAIPSTISAQESVSVSTCPGSLTTAVRLIDPGPSLPALSIRTDGAALFTT